MAKWGIIGTGSIAQTFFEDIHMVEQPQEVVAVLGHTSESTNEFAAKNGIGKKYNDIREFLDNSGTEIAYVATPHPQHLKYAKACLENGIAVLCEKPITLNADQCSELIESSKTNQCFLMEAMWIRFLPGIEKVLELIDAGRIGKVISVKASMHFKAPHDPSSRYFNPALGGGSLLDLGIYPVFLSHLLLGKPDTVKAIGTLSPEGVDETCSILFHYKDGRHAVLESSLIEEHNRDAEIVGEKGTIKILHPWFEKPAGIELHVSGDGKIVYPCHWPGHGLQFEIEEVLRCVARKQIESEKITHAFSLEVMKVMDNIREQIRLEYEMYE